MENGFSSRAQATRIAPWLGLVAIAALTVGSTAYSATHIKSTGDHVPGEIIIKMSGAKSIDDVESIVQGALSQRVGNFRLDSVRAFRTDTKLFTVRLKSDDNLRTAIDALEADAMIDYAEPNFIYTALDAGMPNDPDMAKLWSFKNDGQADASGQMGTPGSDIEVAPVWAAGVTGSRDVKVAIIDTGVDWTHPDIAPNIWTNPGEIEGNNVDDDGNGFVDDIHGWNFINNTPNALDDHSHGTHCAGTIGASGNDGRGIVGVNWNVSIIAVKFLSASGSGTLEDAVEGINYATLVGANVMSNSWGGGGYTQTMYDAIVKSRDAGILFVAAAGNSSNNNDTNPAYPAGYEVDNVLAVAATDNQDKLASFSSYGRTTVHVAAPGVKIYSSVKGGGYEHYSGTSMATPHVSGIAALLLSANQTMSYTDLKERIIRTSDPVRGLRRVVAARGRVNVNNAYFNIVPPSNEPDESAWSDFDAAAESVHPYENSKEYVFTVKSEGAKYVRVHFEKVDVENGYDKVTIEQADGQVIETLTGQLADYTSDYVEGDTLVVRLRADSSVAAWGFKVDGAQSIHE